MAAVCNRAWPLIFALWFFMVFILSCPPEDDQSAAGSKVQQQSRLSADSGWFTFWSGNMLHFG